VSAGGLTNRQGGTRRVGGKHARARPEELVQIIQEKGPPVIGGPVFPIPVSVNHSKLLLMMTSDSGAQWTRTLVTSAPANAPLPMLTVQLKSSSAGWVSTRTSQSLPSSSHVSKT